MTVYIIWFSVVWLNPNGFMGVICVIEYDNTTITTKLLVPNLLGSAMHPYQISLRSVIYVFFLHFIL